mgnify:CR=1 FL=1
MKLAGVAIGALMIGGAVIYLMPTTSAQTTVTPGGIPTPVTGCMDSSATNYNPDATVDEGCNFDDSDKQQEYEDEKIEEQQEIEEENEKNVIDEIKKSCPGLYKTNNDKKGQEAKEHIKLNKTGAIGCAVEQVKINIWSNKTNYVQGEDVIIYVNKRFYEDQAFKDGKWRGWDERTSFDGESLDFYMGVWDEYTDIHLKGTDGEMVSAIDGVRINSFMGDSTCCWQKFTFNTSTLQIAEPLNFTIKAKFKKGGEGCPGDGFSDSGTENNAFTIYPSSCNIETNTSSAESNNNVLSAEHFIQSYHNSWR